MLSVHEGRCATEPCAESRPLPPPLLGWSPTQAIGLDICLAQSSHNTEAWLRASVPRYTLSEDFWITHIPGMGSN